MTVERIAGVLFACALMSAGCRSDLLSCSDGIRNGDETDVDCGGGACAACVNGLACRAKTDCASLLCASDHSCRDPNPCHDGVRDGSESDIDCGGACPACADGKRCGAPTDCFAGACTAGRCGVASSCGDGIQNGHETGVDCGGPDCPRCATGQGCLAGPDCVSALCVSGVCRAGPCRDGILDGSETDIDCGGPTCPPCADGNSCLVASDCVSKLCNERVCQTSSMSCPEGYKINPQSGLCICDPATCATCCNALENNLCGISGDPALSNCGSHGQTCFRCDPKKETCFPGLAGDYCAPICDGGACAGCCQRGPMLKNFCVHGDDDGACGVGGGPCASCPMGQRCVKHACVPVPDGGP